jgi:two-component system, chemotaxis family, sensor kinase CheA
MTDRQGALRDKYRAATRDRLRTICQLLRAVEGPRDGNISQAMRELHAVKGESSMVGLDVMSRLAHALETFVAQGQSEGQASYRELADVVDGLVATFDQPFATLLQEPAFDELLGEIEAALPGDATVNPLRPASPRNAGCSLETEQVKDTQANTEANAQEHIRFTRVDTVRIDGLCDAIAEVTLKLGQLESDFSGAVNTLDEGDKARPLAALRQRFESLRQELDAVASSAWALRLVQVTPSLDELANYAKSLAKSLGKAVAIEILAAGVELERNVLDELNEPLLHIVRNALDHGIEAGQDRGGKSLTARLCLSAEARGASVMLSIEDDGAGLDAASIRNRAVALELVTRERASLLTDAESLELIFMDRFTQRDSVSNLSGRGVGLSAARRKVEGIGGAIRVESKVGVGTRFDILVPSTLSRERVLLVEIANTLCCIPARWVRAVIGNLNLLEQAKEKNYTTYNGRLLVVRSVANWMTCEPGQEGNLVVVEIAGRDGAFLVDRVLGERDILRLSADPILASGQRIEASGMLDDGKVVLFLRWAEALRTSARGYTQVKPAPIATARTNIVLVVDDSPVIRDIVSEVLVSAGLKVITADNGRAAKRIIDAGGCDLVISDVEMPELSGLELLEQIRKTNDSLPVIMLTTRSAPESRHKAASLGANAYIVKSEFQGNVLLDVVRQFLELPA